MHYDYKEIYKKYKEYSNKDKHLWLAYAPGVLPMLLGAVVIFTSKEGDYDRGFVLSFIGVFACGFIYLISIIKLIRNYKPALVTGKVIEFEQTPYADNWQRIKKLYHDKMRIENVKAIRIDENGISQEVKCEPTLFDVSNQETEFLQNLRGKNVIFLLGGQNTAFLINEQLNKDDYSKVYKRKHTKREI